MSLQSGDTVKKLQFSSDVVSLHAGPSPIFVVVLKDSIHAFDMTTLNLLFVIKGKNTQRFFTPGVTKNMAAGARSPMKTI